MRRGGVRVRVRREDVRMGRDSERMVWETERRGRPGMWGMERAIMPGVGVSALVWVMIDCFVCICV